MWHRTSLLQRFGGLSLLLIVVIGVVAGVLLRDILRDRTIEDAQRTAVSVAVVGVQSQLTPADLQRDFLPLPPARVAELDDGMGRAITVGTDDGEIGDVDGFVRIKVWNPQHWIVYSDNPALTGRWFPGDDELDASLAGEVTWEVTDLSSPEEFEERDFGRLLAVYVPLRADGDRFVAPDDTSAPVIGASEVYLPWQPIEAAIARDTARLWMVLAIGLALLYAGLYRLVAGASARLRHQSAENDYLARHDTLTGLANRRGFEEQATARAETHDRLTVVLIDLDRFQEINDTLSHDVGDEVLVRISRRLEELAQPDDVIARLGGDEFALLRPGATAGDAGALGEQVAAAVTLPVTVGDLQLDVAASVGVAWCPEHGDDIGALLRHAEIAMYRAKERRTRVELYHDDINHFSPERLELASEVRRAIDRRELVIYLQPQADLATGEVVAAEALVRWQHPEQGLLGPGAFLPVVESTELIRPLTRYVIDEALATGAQLREAGTDLTVAVNLSAHGLSDPQLVGAVTTMLARHSLPAGLLRLELTESALLHDPTGGRLVLDQLRELGVRLSVDDFGTGYASLAYLRDLPVDELKIDRSLVEAAGSGGNDEALLEACIALGHRLGMTIVAEGIEEPATLAWLAHAGCDLAQGYLLARPMPADDLAGWLQTHAPQVERLVRGDRVGVRT